MNDKIKLKKHIKSECARTVGLKSTGHKCLREKPRGQCRGFLHDTILDWEDSLPDDEMRLSEAHCKRAQLCMCLGTSLQIMPVGNYPLLTKKKGGKVVVINLQKTRVDKYADLVINSKLDVVFQMLFEKFYPFARIQLPRPVQICLKLSDDDDIDKSLLNVSNIFVD